jgi:hypothetical protein
MKYRSISLFAMILFISSSAAIRIEDTNLHYKGYLPDSWVRIIENDSCHIFTDTSSSGAICYLTKYNMESESEDDWTRSFFIAQKMIYEYSIHYYSNIIYFDSSRTYAKQQSSWAPEMFTRCYSADTSDMAWDEYVCFTAINGIGYEFLVIGDTAELETNFHFYTTLMHSIIISNGLGKSSNFLLSYLDINPHISFDIPFAPFIDSCSSTVGFSVNSISIKAVTDDNAATISVQDQQISPGSTFNQGLAIGTNKIRIVVTAPDLTSRKMYTLVINRLQTDLHVRNQRFSGTAHNFNVNSIYTLSGKKYGSIKRYQKPDAAGMYIYKYNLTPTIKIPQLR